MVEFIIATFAEKATDISDLFLFTISCTVLKPVLLNYINNVYDDLLTDISLNTYLFHSILNKRYS